MIWLTWRQFRPQAYVTAGALAVLGVFLLVTGIRMADGYNAAGLSACGTSAHCVLSAGRWIISDRVGLNQAIFAFCIVLTYATPGLIGMFWGAPLLTRELETGAFRLAWTQSVPRDRWMTVKLGFVGACAMATTGLLVLMVNWWAQPIYKSAAISADGNTSSLNRFTPNVFGFHGIVPIGYAAFAFMLGVTAGVLIKRSLPAMAVVPVVFTFVQLAWPYWVRAHLMTPVRSTTILRGRGISGWATIFGRQIVVVGRVHKPGA